jgi:predicted AlkP superfamily pyrophosphatase or phosphodiesterase
VIALVLLLPSCTDSKDSREGSAPKPDDRRTLAAPVEVETAAPPKGNWLKSACALPDQHLVRIARGYFPSRSPDISLVPRAPNFFGSFTSTSHSGPWKYVQRVPIVFYGPGYIASKGEVTVGREVTSADIAPTIAELIDFDFPTDRPGRPLTEALLPEDQRHAPPKLVMTVVWDGGGRDVLQYWPNAWPNLQSLIRNGTSYSEAIVGSSPSVTPAVHATIGTGTFPSEHAIVDIPLRVNGKIEESWPGKSPKHLEVSALGDLYDVALDNEPLIGVVADHWWHLGMIGHGAFLKGGDRDYGLMTSRSGTPETNPVYYQLPAYIRQMTDLFDKDVHTLDVSDGEADNRWRGNDVFTDPKIAHETPAAALYQTRVLRKLITREGFGADDVPDLLFTNYKQIDYTGHRFNMVEPEMRDSVLLTDQELGELTRFLDDQVGRGRWVMAVTADHGSTPSAVTTDAWPIRMAELLADVSHHFGLSPEELFEIDRVTGLWVNRETLEANDISLEELSDYFLGLEIGDNAGAVSELPEGYDERLSEPIFSAVFPSAKIPEILDCAGVRV